NVEVGQDIDSFIYCALINRDEIGRIKDVHGYLRAYSRGPLMFSPLSRGTSQSNFNLNKGYSSHRAPVAALATDGHGQTMVSIGENGSIVVWKLKDGVLQRVRQLEGRLGMRATTALPSRATDIAFSPVGRRLLTASQDGAARIWEVVTGKEIAILRGHEAGL